MGTPYGGDLLHNGWQPVHGPTPYGPLWTAVERAAYVLSRGSVPVGITLIKVPTFLAVLGTAALIWRLLGKLRPERRFTATMLFLANPLVLIELAGDGHNDAVAGFFVVLAISATVRRRAFVAVIALAAAALVKADVLPLGLLMIVALVLWRQSLGRVVLEVAAGAVVALAGAVALFAPYWVGFATLQPLLGEAAPAPGWSVSGILATVVTPVHAQLALATLLVVPTIAACFLVRTVPGFIRACGIVTLVTLVLLPQDWPWYAALASTLLALEAAELDIVAVLLLTLGSRIAAPFGDANAIGAMTYQLFTTTQALLAQTLPGLVALYATSARALTGWARGERRADQTVAGRGGASAGRRPRAALDRRRVAR
jgi:alpha-1,6-mannosyltransferase